MRPEYCEPAVVFNSTVAFRDFTLEANALYFSSSSSRVAAFAMGRVCAEIVCFFVTTFVDAHPPEKAASVATAIHKFGLFIGEFEALHFNYSNLATGSRDQSGQNLWQFYCGRAI